MTYFTRIGLLLLTLLIGIEDSLGEVVPTINYEVTTEELAIQADHFFSVVKGCRRVAKARSSFQFFQKEDQPQGWPIFNMDITHHDTIARYLLLRTIII